MSSSFFLCLHLCHAALEQHHTQVSGVGKYPFLALERADLEFGNVLVGEQVEQSVRLSNQGLLPADFTVTQVQPPLGSLADSSVKITPTRSGVNVIAFVIGDAYCMGSGPS